MICPPTAWYLCQHRDFTGNYCIKAKGVLSMPRSSSGGRSLNATMPVAVLRRQASRLRTRAGLVEASRRTRGLYCDQVRKPENHVRSRLINAVHSCP